MSRSAVIDYLESFNRKERFFLVGAVLGIEDDLIKDGVGHNLRADRACRQMTDFAIGHFPDTGQIGSDCF